MYKKTTQIPNVLLDYHLRNLANAELKILLVIMRQTHGWVDKYTKVLKTRDRISHSQFMEKTGLSRRIITQTIPKLQRRGLIAVTDHAGKTLASGREQTGRTDSTTTLVADLTIGPATKQVDFSHSVPIDTYLANPGKVRESMKQLLDMILGFFEMEAQKVESGALKDE